MHLREALSSWANLDQSSYHRSAASRQLLSLFTYMTDITFRVEIRGDMELRSIYRSASPVSESSFPHLSVLPLLPPLLAFLAKDSSPSPILTTHRRDDVHLRLGSSWGSHQNRSGNCRNRERIILEQSSSTTVAGSRSQCLANHRGHFGRASINSRSRRPLRGMGQAQMVH